MLLLDFPTPGIDVLQNVLTSGQIDPIAIFGQIRTRIRGIQADLNAFEERTEVEMRIRDGQLIHPVAEFLKRRGFL